MWKYGKNQYINKMMEMIDKIKTKQVEKEQLAHHRHSTRLNYVNAFRQSNWQNNKDYKILSKDKIRYKIQR